MTDKPQTTTKWQSIELLPTNKVVIVCHREEPDRIYAASWTGKRWRLYGGHNSLYMRPTHFMEIPEIPS